MVTWLDENQDVSKEENAAKQKEMETVAMPIMQKLYASAAPSNPDGPDGPDMTNFTPEESADTSEPHIEEVD